GSTGNREIGLLLRGESEPPSRSIPAGFAPVPQPCLAPPSALPARREEGSDGVRTLETSCGFPELGVIRTSTATLLTRGRTTRVKAKRLRPDERAMNQ